MAGMKPAMASAARSFGGFRLARPRLLARARGRFRRAGGLRLPRRLARGAARRRGALLAAAARASRLDQPDRLLERDRIHRHVGRERGVDAVVVHVRPVASVLHHDRAALVGMIAERPPGIGAEAAPARPLGALLLDQRHRAVEPDAEHVVACGEIGVGLAVLDIGPEAADAGDDRLAVVGMLADLARQRKQPERAREIKVIGRETLRQAGALGLLALDRFAELQIWAEAARAQRHLETAVRIFTQLLDAVGAVRAVAGGELARIAALRIVRAADEAAELAELEGQPAGLATRALARV